LGGGGALDYRAYGGTIFIDTTATSGSPFQVQNFNVPYLVGGRLVWETPLEGLRFAGSVQALRLDATVLTSSMTTTGMASMPLSANIQIPAVLTVASAEYVAGDLLLAAEYSRWYVGQDTSNAMVFPASPTVISERAYGMVTYRASKWLQPGAYYSVMFPNVDDRSGRQNMQHDVSTTLRFDINSFWLMKAEAHYMIGTAGLDATLNNGTPLSALQQSWGVFLLKTTAYF
jgi:hypothetical protein